MRVSLRLQCLLLSLSTSCRGNPAPVPNPRPNPIPDAQPNPNPVPNPNPNPEPNALPGADADAQSYTNNAPFSGAIYIVSPNGQEITTTGQNWCPNYASLSCGSMGAPSWCCPSGYACAAVSNIIGCCPSGSDCNGAVVNVASVTTVTVQYVQQTSVVYVQPQPSTAVYTVAQNPQPSAVVYQGGFCSTLTMQGHGLPTTGQGACGVILIVNDSTTVSGYGVGALVVLLHFIIAMCGLAFWA